MKEKIIANIIISLVMSLSWYVSSRIIGNDAGIYLGLGVIYSYLVTKDLK